MIVIGRPLAQVTHWQHPRFHAYFPAGNSYPSILADMLSDGIGCVGFSWVSPFPCRFLSFSGSILQPNEIVVKAASPACTELETIVLDWVGESKKNIGKSFTKNYRECKFIARFTGRMIALPEPFLAFSEKSKGGGVIQVERFGHQLLRNETPHVAFVLVIWIF